MDEKSALIMAALAATAAAAAAALITRLIERRKLRSSYREIEMLLDSFRSPAKPGAAHDSKASNAVRPPDAAPQADASAAAQQKAEHSISGRSPASAESETRRVPAAPESNPAPGIEAAGSRLLLEASREDRDRILRQLRRIDDAMRLAEERSRLEKEETKAVVTDIAHQLKTPVAVMKMSAELLSDDSLSAEERGEFSARFESSLAELETLVNSLLQISRMETGLIELETRRRPLVDTIRTAVSCIAGKADERGISVEMLDPDGSAGAPIPHDSRWLAEAIINVLDNSIKYSPEGSSIVIRVMRRSDWMRIEIEDEGIGIPKEDYNKVMTRFYRGRSETVAREKGSGVGLYLVNKIVRMHGGIATIKPGHGKRKDFPGTTIVIQLPA